MNPDHKEYTPIEVSTEFDDSLRQEEYIPQAIPIQTPQSLDAYSTQPPVGYGHGIPHINPPMYQPQHPVSHPQFTHYTHQQPHYIPQVMHPAPQQFNPVQFMQTHQTISSLPKQPASLNDLTLMLARNDNEINEYRFYVMVNWIAIGFIAVGAAIGLLILTLFSTFTGLICQHSNSSECSSFLTGIGLPILLIIVLVVVATAGALCYLHYVGIGIFREKQEKTMECMCIGYYILLALNVLTMNLIGIAIYGYLAFAAHKLKAIFKRRQEIEYQIRRAQEQQPRQNLQVLRNPLPVVQPQFIQMAQF